MKKVIILAAGEGTRMKSKHSKVLHKIVNKTLLDYVVEASKEAGVEETIAIVGKNEAEVRAYFGDAIKYRVQNIGPEFPYGTGYAIMQAVDLIEDEDTILVLSGDVPLISNKTIKNILDYHESNELDATVLTALFEDPFGYGRIIKENGKFLKIVEQKDGTEEELLEKEINSGIYSFNGKKLKDSLKQLNTDNAQGELYLTDVFSILKEGENNIGTFMIEDHDEIRGINSKVQLSEAEEIMRMRINKTYMDAGVVLENPRTITIEKGVEIGRDTVIEAGTKILGKTKIGEDCFIGFNSRIMDSTIGNNVKIQSSYVEKSIVEDYTDIGPFARLRPNAHLKQHVHIGNFVEVKNSTVGDGTKAGHLAYIGDSDLGKDINVGCGVIFVNYDGKFKHRSVIEDGAFIGSNSNIVAPVHVEKEGYIAAGSTITRNIGEGELSIERAVQRNIPGYVEKKKRRDLKREQEK